MKKEKPPIEENVDIELEYKLLHLYDKVKPYLKQILIGIIILILAVLLFIYYKNKKEEKRNNAGALVYEISKDINNKKYDEALKKIKFFKANYSDTDHIKLVYGYEIIINKEKNSLKEETLNKLKEKLNTGQTKGYFTEFQAYLDYKSGKLDYALKKLNTINQSNFNYYSALSLKALIFSKKGNVEKAKGLFSEIREFSKDKYKYFESLANENI